ncbi:LAMB2 protein, partial [Sapayoa aenigma]|nr:LAMB2 protein [Sapayoa aenigma]
IENVVTSFAPRPKKAWWQSENGVEHVSIQLDLEAEFHFTHLIMTFKTFRPAAMLVERSADFGRSWKVYRYFAYDCAASFPHIPHGPPRHIDDVVCESRYSDIEPSTEGEVIYRVLDPAIPIRDPYSPAIQSDHAGHKMQWVNHPGLNLDWEQEGRNLQGRAAGKLLYWGSSPVVALFCTGGVPGCLCRGLHSPGPHTTRPCTATCIGVEPPQLRTSQSGCMQPYAYEPNHAQPWASTLILLATSGLGCHMPCHGAIPTGCDCNEHSRQCHFDMAVFLATGNTSGAVCDGCQHNTMGRRCHLCKPFYYKDPTKDLRDPTVCRGQCQRWVCDVGGAVVIMVLTLPTPPACDCDPEGSRDGGLCDGADDPARGLIAGQCRCKDHVAGPRCDRCKPGFFGLSTENPRGCQRCQCDPRGTVADDSRCDPVSGECFCKRLVTGRNCNQCLPEHWGLSHDLPGCRPCDCDVGGARNNLCAMETGQCQCRSHVMGRRCEQVEPGFYRINLDHYTYEAEDARLHQGSVVQREPPVDRLASWTGTGFARMLEGGWVEFHVSDVPFSTEYDVIIRYEPQHPEAWQEVRLRVLRPSPVSASSPCGNTIPADDQL